MYWDPLGHSTVLFADAALSTQSAAPGPLADKLGSRASLEALLKVVELAKQTVLDG